MNFFEILSGLFTNSNDNRQGFNLSDLLALFMQGDDIASIFSLIEKVRSGEIPLMTLLMQLAPVLLPLFLQQKTAQSDNESLYADNALSGIKAIEDIASSDIISSITNYFEDTAS